LMSYGVCIDTRRVVTVRRLGVVVMLGIALKS